MAIYKKIEWVDGGPNDKGQIIGYIKANTETEAKAILNVDHGFITVHLITDEEYYERLDTAQAQVDLFILQTNK